MDNEIAENLERLLQDGNSLQMFKAIDPNTANPYVLRFANRYQCQYMADSIANCLQQAVDDLIPQNYESLTLEKLQQAKHNFEEDLNPLIFDQYYDSDLEFIEANGRTPTAEEDKARVNGKLLKSDASV